MNLNTKKRLVAPSAFRDPEFYCGVFTESSIRWLIFNEKKNGFSCCVYRAGRKVLIDLDKFDKWLESKQSKRSVSKKKKAKKKVKRKIIKSPT